MSEKKSGCGCWSFSFGCFFGMLLLVGVVVGGGYLFLTKVGFVFDTGLKYAYPNLKPQIQKSLSDLPEDQQKQIMTRIDTNVNDYLALSSTDRRKVRKKLIEVFKSIPNPQVDKAMLLQEIEALIRELRAKKGHTQWLPIVDPVWA